MFAGFYPQNYCRGQKLKLDCEGFIAGFSDFFHEIPDATTSQLVRFLNKEDNTRGAAETCDPAPT